MPVHVECVLANFNINLAPSFSSQIAQDHTAGQLGDNLINVKHACAICLVHSMYITYERRPRADMEGNPSQRWGVRHRGPQSRALEKFLLVSCQWLPFRVECLPSSPWVLGLRISPAGPGTEMPCMVKFWGHSGGVCPIHRIRVAAACQVTSSLFLYTGAKLAPTL